MKKLVIPIALVFSIVCMSSVLASQDEKKKDTVECCCKECVCNACTCETDCSECRGCRKNEECKRCKECTHEGYCCDYRKHHRRHCHEKNRHCHERHYHHKGCWGD